MYFPSETPWGEEVRGNLEESIDSKRKKVTTKQLQAMTARSANHCPAK